MYINLTKKNCIKMINISILPTEIVFKILGYLPPKEVIKCSAVCRHWNQIVTELCNNNNIWCRNCQLDFEDIYNVAKFKAKVGLNWYNIYQSLSLWALWPLLMAAKYDLKEFVIATEAAKEIIDFVTLQDGIIGVHRREEIIYYNVKTMKVTNKTRTVGSYLSYSESLDALVILCTNLVLNITRKMIKPYEETTLACSDVKHFLLHNKFVYIVHLNNEVFQCDLRKGNLIERHLFTCSEEIMCLSYKDKLYALTLKQKILCYEDGLQTISLEVDSLKILHRYNFLERLDWRVYTQWLYAYNHTMPIGFLQDITIIFVYGKIVAVGTSWGVLRLYYLNGEFDLANAQLLKQWNFMEREDCPVLSICPILKIDIIEAYKGHTVLVAMPKKIVAIDFLHD